MSKAPEFVVTGLHMPGVQFSARVLVSPERLSKVKENILHFGSVCLQRGERLEIETRCGESLGLAVSVGTVTYFDSCSESGERGWSPRMTTLWHKDRYWPAETSPITGGPLPGAIPPGIYAESVKDWERLRAKSFRPGLDVIRKVGVSKVPGIAPAGLMLKVASAEQLAWLTANEKVEIPAPVQPAVGVRVDVSPLAILRRRA